MTDTTREDVILMLADKNISENAIYSVLYLLQFSGIDLGFRYSITQRGTHSKQAMQVVDLMESNGIVESTETLSLTRLGIKNFDDLVVTYDIFDRFTNCISAIEGLTEEGLELLVLAQVLFENEFKTNSLLSAKKNNLAIKDAIEKFKCKEYENDVYDLVFATLLKIRQL